MQSSRIKIYLVVIMLANLFTLEGVDPKKDSLPSKYAWLTTSLKSMGHTSKIFVGVPTAFFGAALCYYSLQGANACMSGKFVTNDSLVGIELLLRIAGGLFFLSSSTAGGVTAVSGGLLARSGAKGLYNIWNAKKK